MTINCYTADNDNTNDQYISKRNSSGGADDYVYESTGGSCLPKRRLRSYHLVNHEGKNHNYIVRAPFHCFQYQDKSLADLRWKIENYTMNGFVISTFLLILDLLSCTSAILCTTDGVAPVLKSQNIYSASYNYGNDEDSFLCPKPLVVDNMVFHTELKGMA